jgi:threonyl-tRNA synthetase
LVLGPKEAQSNTVNVRVRRDRQTKTIDLDRFLVVAEQKITGKKIDLAF